HFIHRYHGREAVVVSALQVEKHPVSTPGPFTPPPARLQTRPSIVSRPQPKPHSPKMKLRYLKSVFPVVEETILLDTLCNSDNNVTHATERLLHLGFNKKDTPPPRVSLKKKEQPDDVREIPLRPPFRPGVTKTEEEKKEMKNHLCQKYPNLPEMVISLAMDSASYNEETAETILSLMLEEKPVKQKETTEEVSEAPKIITEDAEIKTEAVPISPVAIDEKSFKKRQKGRVDQRQVLIKETQIEVKEDAQMKNCTFESPLLIKPKGPNSLISKGPNESLLLEDYVPWIGPKRNLAMGSNKSLCVGPRGAKGPDLSARKGPQSSLAKGSIYSKFQVHPGTRCN
ncbi:uncharacterized protein LOC112128050, partial [Cimex lectularius]|uniref:CUE domain-containing protein n=1 Tax=Cimex lectularius TaxID=79782 RepID=A0A8I6SRG9_CIMLE